MPPVPTISQAEVVSRSLIPAVPSFRDYPTPSAHRPRPAFVLSLGFPVRAKKLAMRPRSTYPKRLLPSQNLAGAAPTSAGYRLSGRSARICDNEQPLSFGGLL